MDIKLSQAELEHYAVLGLEAECARLEAAIASIRDGSSSPVLPKRGQRASVPTSLPSPEPKQRKRISEAGRRRIAAAQRKRWKLAKLAKKQAQKA